MDTEMFSALERAQKKLFPGAIALPQMTVGATDSAQLRAKGMQVYGINTLANDTGSAQMNGNDERVNIVGLGTFLEYL